MFGAHLLFLVFFLLGDFCRQVFGVHIIWDKNLETVDLNDLVLGRMGQGEVRLPNRFLIYPGTKWCGVGNIADDENDLGHFADADKCCRTHDHCSDFIEGFQTGHNLTNHRFYTKLNCDCDEAFYKCLKSVNTVVSKTIGVIYFNALGTQCFHLENPIEKCMKYVYAPWKKCVLYKLNEKGEKVYQWFDLPLF